MSRNNSYDFGATTTTTRNTFRPCIWQASIGPLFIRSVWMDRQGYRHFILNTDWTDQQANSYKKLTTKTHKPKQLDPLGRSNLKHETRNQRDTLEESSRNKNSNISQQSHLRSGKKLCKQLPSGQNKTSAGLLKRQIIHRNNLGATVTKDSLPEETPGDKKSVLSSDKFSIDFPLNPGENYQLTERVLQWLDLAGRTPLAPQEDNVVVKPSTRVFTANPSLGGGFSSSARKSAIKRIESIHHLSLTLNEEDFFDHLGHKRDQTNVHFSLLSGRKVRQMSSSKIKPIVQPPIATNKINSPKSTTSSTSSGAGPGTMTTAAGSQNKPPPSSSKLNNRQKKSLGKLGKTESIENQYRSMIHRQLLETNCNTQLAKRQLHIFMPNMPSKGMATGGACNPQSQSQNDCDSCLNSLLSEPSKP